MKITPEQGERILSEYPGLEKSGAPQNYLNYARIFGVEIPEIRLLDPDEKPCRNCGRVLSKCLGKMGCVSKQLILGATLENPNPARDLAGKSETETESNT
jgi:hypothetical protein